MTDPRIAGLLNRPAQRSQNFEARLKIRERTPGGIGSSTIISASLPIGSGTEVTQEDVDAIGIKQVGTDDASLRIIPSAGSKAALQFFDGSTEKWKNYKHTDNSLVWRDMVGSNLGQVQVTIASPAVFTTNRATTGLLTHGLTAGTPVKFTTTGALPTGLTAGTTYYVIAAGLTAYSFQVSSSVTGTPVVNTSGTQSGTHTLYKLAATDIITVGSGNPDGGGIYVDRRLTLRGSVGAPNIFANKTFDAGASPRCLIFAWPSAYSGTWHNGARGDQLYNDATNGPIFTNGNIYQTQIPTSWNQCGTLQGFASDMEVNEVEGPVTITAVEGTGGNTGKIIRVAAGHGYQTSPTYGAGECTAPVHAVVTISGFTAGPPDLRTLNGRWYAELIDAQTFRIPSTVNATNSASPAGTLRSQRHLYKDCDAYHMRLESNAPGGNLTNEWNHNVNAGAWCKAVGLNMLVRDQNTYQSYKKLTNAAVVGGPAGTGFTPNEVFSGTSYWPHTGSVGVGIFTCPSTPLGQPGTALHIGAVAGTPEFKRCIVISDSLAPNSLANDKFCIEPGDAYGVRVGIGALATVDQTFNNSGLPARLHIAPIADPTAKEDGIALGASATAVRIFRAGPALLKITDTAGAAGDLWANGNITAGSPSTSGGLTLYSNDGTGCLVMTEQSTTPSTTANAAKLYAEDDGSGNTQVRYLFSSGASQVIAKMGGIPSWAVGAATALGGAAAGMFISSTGEMSTQRDSSILYTNWHSGSPPVAMFQIRASGEHRFGDGTNAVDVGLHRTAAGILTVTDATASGFGGLHCNQLRHGRGTSPTLGFFAATLAAKQTVTGAKGGNAALGSLLTALATYGLITDSSTA